MARRSRRDLEREVEQLRDQADVAAAADRSAVRVAWRDAAPDERSESAASART